MLGCNTIPAWPRYQPKDPVQQVTAECLELPPAATKELSHRFTQICTDEQEFLALVSELTATASPPLICADLCKSVGKFSSIGNVKPWGGGSQVKICVGRALDRASINSRSAIPALPYERGSLRRCPVLNGNPDIVFQLFLLNESGESARDGLRVVAIRFSDAFFQFGVVNRNVQHDTVHQGPMG